jgi:TMEM175 potassium channel family protein
MYPKARIDALTDGIFAVAMTILILDVRLPEDFHPADDGAVAHALIGLWPKFFPYVLSFYVLGSSWLANIKLRSRGEFVDKQYASWWLLLMLLATCLPFSTTLVGRFAQYSSSVLLYAANMAALAAIGYRLVMLLPDLEDDEHTRDRKVSLLFLIGTSALCAAFTMVNPAKALWVYALNIFASQLARWIGKRRAGDIDLH